jgi:hypothetical protein
VASRTLSVQITGDSASLQRAFKASEAAASKWGAKMQAAERQANRSRQANDDHSRSLDRLNVALGNSAHQTQVFQGVLSTLKMPAAIAAVGGLAQAAAAAGAGVTALASSLAPLGGALAAYPALASAAGQGLGVFKLATSDIFAAVGGVNQRLDENAKAFRELSPEAQKVARHLEQLKGPLRDLASLSQREMFPGLERGITGASRNLPVLRRIVRDTARELGSLGEQFGNFVGSRAFGRDLATQGQRNVRWMRDGGHIALNLAHALEDVTIAAGPLVNWMVKGARAGSEWVRQQAHLGRESGALAGFFDETRTAMSRVLKIGGALAEAFWNIGRAGKPLGDEILVNLVKSADAFRDWTDSARGQNAIRDYFDRARPAIMELGRLIRDATKAFFRLGAGEGLAPLLRMIRTRLLPAFERVADQTSKALGPALINALGEMADVFGHLAGANGPLVAFVDLLTLGLKAVNGLLDSVPGLNAAVVTLAGGMGLVRALKITEAITGVGRLRKMLQGTARDTAAINAVSGGVGGAVPTVVAGTGGGRGRAPVPAGAGRLTRLRGALGGLGAGALAAVGGAPGAALLAGGAVVLAGQATRARRERETETGRAPKLRQAIQTGSARDIEVLGQALDAMNGKVTKSRAAWDAFRKTHNADRFLRRAGIDADIQRKDLERLGRVYENTTHDATRFLNRIGRGWDDYKDRIIKNSRTAAQFADEQANLIRVSLGRNTRAGRDAAEANFRGLARTINQQVGNGVTSVTQATRVIRAHLVTDTREGREAGAKEFRRLASAVEQSINRDSPKSVREGTRKINSLLQDALETLGFTAAQARGVRKAARTNVGPQGLGGINANERATVRASGGWVGRRGDRGPDAVPAMLGVGEAVLNRHQQRIVEGLLGEGFLDRLFARVQTPHYAARGGYVPQPAMALASGGRVPRVLVDVPGAQGRLAQRAVDLDRAAANRILDRRTAAAAAASAVNGGAGSTTGLAPQVKRALAWARGHGWTGSVTSGFRSRAKQEQLYANRASNPNPVAPPGTSMHERGLAVDVSDIPGFQRAMSSAPANARLTWFGPGDPVHFSTTGHARGGRVRRFAKGGRAGQIFDFFRNQGFTRAQAAAWVGNFTQESSLNPAAIQPGGEGHGLAQWGGTRFAALQRFARRRGTAWTDLGTQLQFVMYELRGSEASAGRAIAGTRGRGLAAAVNVIGAAYERFKTQGDRLGPAADVLKRFAKRTGGSSGNLNLPSRLDFLTARGDLAGLTGGSRDDVRAAEAALQYWRRRLRRARQSGDPRRISEAASGLSSARSTMQDLRPSRQETLTARLDLAGLTRTKTDDRRIADQLLKNARWHLNRARRSGDPARISEAVSNYTTARDAVRELRPARRKQVPLSEAFARAYEPQLAYDEAVAAGTPGTEDDERARQLRYNIAQARLTNTAARLMSGNLTAKQRRNLMAQATTYRQQMNDAAPPAAGTAELPASIRRAQAEAALSMDTTKDDTDAATAARDFFQGQYDAAKASGNDEAIITAAENLKGAKDALESIGQSLQDAIKEQTDALNAVAKAQADATAFSQQLFTTQHGQVMAGIADMVSGQLGGRVGLGAQTPGFAGQRLRY